MTWWDVDVDANVAINAQLQQEAEYENNALHRLAYVLAREGKLGDLRELLNRPKMAKDLVNWENPYEVSQTALQAASWGGYSYITRYLLAEGASAEASKGFHGSIVHASCYTGNYHIANQGLQYSDLDPSSLNDMLLRLVSWAPQDAGLKFLRTIINTPGIDVNHLREEDHETALTQACDRSRTDAALLLISHPGINVNLQTKSGYTALMLAAWKGNIKIVQALCEVKGIEMHHVNQYGKTALQCAETAMYVDTTEVVQYLKALTAS